VAARKSGARRRSTEVLHRVPFALLLGRTALRTGSLGRSQLHLRQLEARLAVEFTRLEAACWRGELDAAGLARLQEVRVATLEIDRAIEGDDEAAYP
jgi:hypothetical protein